MAEYLIQDTTLDAIADAINAKTGGSSAMTPAQMTAAIAAIPSGGGNPITKDEWTIASDYNGTTQGFYYGSGYIDRDFIGVQLIEISNNSAASNVAKGAYINTNSNHQGIPSTYLRDTSVTLMSAGQLFNISAGGVITRYKIPSSAFPT